MNNTKHCAALLKLLPTLSIFIAQETQEATILESSQFWVEKYLPALFKIQIQNLATHFRLSIFLNAQEMEAIRIKPPLACKVGPGTTWGSSSLENWTQDIEVF